MTVIEPGRLPDPRGAGVQPLRMTLRPQRAPNLGRWLARIPGSFGIPGWRRAFACWALFGALLDMATTMMLGRVDGIYEANPLSAAGQSFVGSVPAYMVATTLLVCAILTVLAVKPVGFATHLVWWAVAVLGSAKIGVAVLNLVVLQAALTASIDRL
jgi:hypothetical protein